jgi:hypothetical protein
MRDMPTGRFVLRAYSALYDTDWQYEWVESQKGEFATTAKAIADSLEEAAPVIVKQAEEAERRTRERQKQAEEERRRQRARERAEARQRAQQAAKDDLRAIVKVWNDAFALEAFSSELLRHAAVLEGEARTMLERKIETARQLMGGQDAIDRFLRWSFPQDQKSDETDDDNDR